MACTYDRQTIFGAVTLTPGVDELVRGEHEVGQMDDSSPLAPSIPIMVFASAVLIG